MKETFFQLEFDKFRRLLTESCHSARAKKRAESISSLSSREEIEYSLDIITECQEIVTKGYLFDFQRVFELNEILYHFEYRAYSFEEFSSIFFTVEKAIEVKAVIAKEEDFFEFCPKFLDECRRMYSLPEIVKRYGQIFSPEGKVLDTASEQLKQIRNRKSALRKSILNSLDRKLNERGLENIVQDKIITQREGRYVIPLKDGGISAVPGIVHGYSGSKATIFVEPSDVIDQNNSLHRLQREEEEEIQRIFEDFTASIRNVRDEIGQNNEILSSLDYYFAAACLSNSLGAVRPKLSESCRLHLVNARHPLLINNYGSIKDVIPFDLELGKKEKLLVLSGPNTGGKTITLKAVGLAVLMTLAGLPISAGPESEVGLFDNVYTDINDEQSIENSLSTFSSHIGKIKKMLESGDQRSLVLIDEIGSATDPEQGSALAQAIMEELLKIGVLGVITTHYTPLKIFAEKSDKCLNAAMQFDPDKHEPTYFFKIGLPGNSFALEIAARLGVRQDIMARAKELAGKKNVELTNLIKAVTVEKKELNELKQRAEQKERRLEARLSRYSRLIEDIEKEKKQIRQDAIKDAGERFAVIQKELNRELEALEKTERSERKKNTKKMLKNISSIQQNLNKENQALKAEELVPVEEVRAGDTVWVQEFSDTGRVVSIDKGQVTVDINNIFFTTKKDKLFRMEKRAASNSRAKDYSRQTKLSDRSVKTELKLLGKTYEEAFPLVEKFLDDGYAAGLTSLRIVHGKGTGVLRSKIRNYLKQLRYVSEFYSPPEEMGGYGVTVVKLHS